jgi:hypothetical protein
MFPWLSLLLRLPQVRRNGYFTIRPTAQALACRSIRQGRMAEIVIDYQDAGMMLICLTAM